MTPRDRYLIKTYGITEAEYEGLLESQGGCCAICSKTPDAEGQRLAVDHDHKTGIIRGILCRYCNHRVVGRHRDGPLLRQIADYVERDTGFRAPKKRPRKRRKAK
jgi:DNA-directed RNA polymerase subunit RPC12/RpoP